MIVGDGQLGVLPRQLVRTASFLVINTMYDLRPVRRRTRETLISGASSPRTRSLKPF
jgi:hypothetical protein